MNCIKTVLLTVGISVIPLVVLYAGPSFAQQENAAAGSFPAVRIVEQNGDKIEGRNAVLRGDSLFVSLDYRDRAYVVSDIKRLYVSDRNNGTLGTGVGFAIGFGVPLGYAMYSRTIGANDGYFDGATETGVFLMSFLTGPLCAVIGNHIGKNVYTGWREYEFGRQMVKRVSVSGIPIHRGVGISVQLHR